MDAQKLKELEEAIEFGRDISSTLHLLGHTEYTFGSTVFKDDMKRATAAELGTQRELVQKMVARADKYMGIPVAAEAKTDILKSWAKVEKAARPYL